MTLYYTKRKGQNKLRKLLDKIENVVDSMTKLKKELIKINSDETSLILDIVKRLNWDPETPRRFLLDFKSKNNDHFLTVYAEFEEDLEMFMNHLKKLEKESRSKSYPPQKETQKTPQKGTPKKNET